MANVPHFRLSKQVRFVDDQYAQTHLARKYDRGKLSFNVEGGSAKLLQVTVKTVKLKP